MYPEYLDTNGIQLKPGQKVEAFLRNSHTVKGTIVEENGKLYLDEDDCDLRLILEKCFQDNYAGAIYEDHPKCGRRYCVFTILE